MFLYDYMSAGFDDIIASLDTEDFDPHQHRKVPHPTTYSETMQHLLKGCLGCGMLAMPSAVARMGIIAAPIGILAIGIFAVYCLQVLVLAQYALCKKLRRGYMAYTMSMRYAVAMGPEFLRPAGPLFSYMIDFFLILWQIGICAIYFVFVAENLKQLIDFHGETNINLRILISYLFPIQLALCMVKNLKVMTPISTIANFLIAVGLLFTLFYLIEDDVEVTDDMLKIQGFMDIPVFIGITLFALEAVGVILALEYNMENPRKFTGFVGLFSIGISIILGLYVALGIAGFLKYGQHSEGSLTLNLPKTEKIVAAFPDCCRLPGELMGIVELVPGDRPRSCTLGLQTVAFLPPPCILCTVGTTVKIPMIFRIWSLLSLMFDLSSRTNESFEDLFIKQRAQMVKFSFALAIFLSFPLQSFVAWQITWRLVGKRVDHNVNVDYALRVLLVVVPYGMAVAAPNLGAFMGLLGALCLSMVAIFFPALMDICVFYPDQYGPFNIKLLSDIFIMVFGMICCCSGVYTSVLEMVDSYS